MDADTSASLAIAKQKSKKKRKAAGDVAEEAAAPSSNSLRDVKKAKKSSTFAETHRPQKPSAIAKAGKGRNHTVSIALPGSILLNAQSPELRTYLAGQIARTCSIFSVDEIVVFHEPNHIAATQASASGNSRTRGKYRQATSEQGSGDEDDMDSLLCRVLQYLEMPQYLRRALIPMHPSLRLAGLLPPLDMPHHLRKSDAAQFREGVSVDTPAGHQPVFGQRQGSFVDVGLGEPVQIGEAVGLGQRVTVKMDEQPSLVPPTTPTTELGYAWGYSVRQASSISNVLLECPHEGGYDLTIGTSERGQDIGQASAAFTGFRHALVIFGGLAGLELTIEADESLGLPAEEADSAFDYWVNVCPNQGSRTIRTEEALMIALARLKSSFDMNGN